MVGAAARLLAVALLGGALAGCVDPAGARADRDFDQIGRAVAGGLSLVIDPGAVQAADGDLDPVRFELRASAPVVEVRIDGDPGRVEIVIDNLTGDAAVTGDGVISVDAPTPLSRHIELSAPAVIRIGPADPAARPVRLAYTSDIHVNIDAIHQLVARVDADPAIEMVLASGDLIGTGSHRGEWDRVMEALAELPVPFYATVGNHELYGGDDGHEFNRRLGRMNVLFDYHGVRVGLADSGAATLAERVFDFLDQGFAPTEPDAGVRIFVTHTPLVDVSGLRNAGFSSRLEAERILAMLVRRHVELLLHGHVHGYAAYRSAGIPTYIVNGGGGRDDQFDGIGPHFLVVDADPIAGTIAATRRDLP